MEDIRHRTCCAEKLHSTTTEHASMHGAGAHHNCRLLYIATRWASRSNWSDPSRMPDGEHYSKINFSTDSVTSADPVCGLQDGAVKWQTTDVLQSNRSLTPADAKRHRTIAHKHDVRPNVEATNKIVSGTAFSRAVLSCPRALYLHDDTELKLEHNLKNALHRSAKNLAKTIKHVWRSLENELSIYTGTHSEDSVNVQMSGTMQAPKTSSVPVARHELVVIPEETRVQSKEHVTSDTVYVLTYSSSLWNKEKNKTLQFVDYAVNKCAGNTTHASSMTMSRFYRVVSNVAGSELMTNVCTATLKTARDMLCSEVTSELTVMGHPVTATPLVWLVQTYDLKRAAVRVEREPHEQRQMKPDSRSDRKEKSIEKNHGDSHFILFIIKSRHNSMAETPPESVFKKSYPSATDTWFVNDIILPKKNNVCVETRFPPSKHEADREALPTSLTSEVTSQHFSRNAEVCMNIQETAVLAVYESQGHSVFLAPCAAVPQNDQFIWKGRLAFDICPDSITMLPKNSTHNGERATAKVNSCMCDGAFAVQHVALVLLYKKPFLFMFYVYCNAEKLQIVVTLQGSVHVLSSSDVLTDIYSRIVKCPLKVLNTLERPRSLEFREVRFSKSDPSSRDVELDDSPGDDPAVKIAYDMQSKKVYCGRSNDCSMGDAPDDCSMGDAPADCSVGDAPGCCRFEFWAKTMPLEVDDEDAFQTCAYISNAERCDNVPAQVLDEEDVTSNSIQRSRNKPAEHDSDFEKEPYKSEKATALPGKADIILSESTRDYKSHDLELPLLGVRLARRRANIIVAYPVHAIRHDSLKRVIASRERRADLDVCRLASFQTWPHLGELSALRCCSAGYCRATADGSASRGDHLTCFRCGCTVSNWVPGVDPLALHGDNCGQHCSYIAEIRRTAPSATAACSIASTLQRPNVADWLSIRGVISATGESAAAIGAYRQAAAEVAAAGSVMIKQLRSEPSAPATNDELAKNESYRLATFANVWTYEHIVTAEELARNGFLYAGPGDRVKCAFCQGLLRNWEPGDRADEQHAQHFTYCRFVQGHDVGNVPIPFWPLTVKSSNEAQRSADATDGTRTDLGISCAVPCHPDFAVEARRLLTFATWPAGHHMQPEALAKSGFFYRGNEDAVQCFFCDCVVINWKTDCDPWAEHARRSSDCSFVIQVKGHDFARRHREEAGQASSDTMTMTSLAVDPREVRARMDSHAVRILLQMDYPLDLVREVIQRRLATVGRDHETSEQLLDDVFQTHDKKQRASAAQKPAGCGTTSAVQPVIVSHQQWKTANNQDQVASRSTTATPTVTVALAASATIGAEARDLLAGSDSLQTGERVSLVANLRADEENRQLKTQLTCKVCMDALVGIVFLPCGHLVCCAECAPAMKSCPICRVSIRGTVRTMMM